METGELLMTLLSLAGVRLPVLIAVAIGVVWVLRAPRTAARSGALAGLLLLATTSVIGLLLSMLPLWLVNAGNFAAVSRLGGLLGAGHFVLGLLEAFGLVLVVWALTRALRGEPPPRAA